MLKKMLSVMLAAAMLVSVGCAVSEQLIGLPNPLTEYDTYADMMAAIPGLRMAEAPADAQDITYTTIDSTIAQIDFLWDGDFYTYRAVKARDDDEYEDLHGVYTDFDHDLDDSDSEEKLLIPEYADDFDFEYNLDDGQVLVSWYCEKCSQRFSLYSETAGYPELNLLFLLIDYPEFIVCHAE